MSTEVMSDDALTILAVGAHPDDPDVMAGGTACLYADHGHDVRFVSVTDGSAGHHELAGATLVRRRHAEATAAADVAGLERAWHNTTRSTLFSYLHIADGAAIARAAVEADHDGHEVYWAVAADTTADVDSSTLADE